MNSAVIAVDFDGTVVDHHYPGIGDPAPEAFRVLRRFVDLDFRLILWTMRSGESLDDAVSLFKRNGIKLWGVNHNPTQSTWTMSPKVLADYYVDDASVGCPVKRFPGFARLAVDWLAVEKLILRAEFGSETGPFLDR